MTLTDYIGLRVAGCRSVRLERFSDERGWLAVAQCGGALPFVPRRFYVISGVPEGTERGRHGHREMHQLYVALRGRVHVELRAQGRRRDVVLDDPSLGLYVVPDTWSAQRFFDDAMLLVLSSGEYDPAGYSHDPCNMHGDIGNE